MPGGDRLLHVLRRVIINLEIVSKVVWTYELLIPDNFIFRQNLVETRPILQALVYYAMLSFIWGAMSLHSLWWRHNGCDSVWNHQPRHCLLNRLFRRRSKKTWKLFVTGLCVGNSPGTGEFPAQMASYAENVSIWWRHHAGRVSYPKPQVKSGNKLIDNKSNVVIIYAYHSVEINLTARPAVPQCNADIRYLFDVWISNKIH